MIYKSSVKRHSEIAHRIPTNFTLSNESGYGRPGHIYDKHSKSDSKSLFSVRPIFFMNYFQI